VFPVEKYVGRVYMEMRRKIEFSNLRKRFEAANLKTIKNNNKYTKE